MCTRVAPQPGAYVLGLKILIGVNKLLCWCKGERCVCVLSYSRSTGATFRGILLLPEYIRLHGYVLALSLGELSMPLLLDSSVER